MSTVLIIAPHPDDETLGCGGTILKHIAGGDAVHWLIVTEAHAGVGFEEQALIRRKSEIERVEKAYSFSSKTLLKFPTARLETVETGTMIKAFESAFKVIQPDTLYVPFPGDAHSDHKIVYSAALSASKWFRASFIKRILAYETLSETEQGLNPAENSFTPNVWVDISRQLSRKLEIMKFYEGESGVFPFPRSNKAIESLAFYRGASAGFNAAEAFVLIKELVR